MASLTESIALNASRAHVALLRATLALLLDHVDYNGSHACMATEMVGAVLPVSAIQAARIALERTR